ncbi:hypothetical protein, partial [Salmonella enterica]|uniref:hypothetical protein n=1 Tax=Salmonella enterica TaxID=28901 RepID=UPI003CF1C1A7
ILYLLSRKGVSYIDIDRPDKEFTIPYVSTFSSFGSFVETPHRMFFDEGEETILIPVAGGLLFYNHQQEAQVHPFKIVVDEIIT